MAGYNFYCHGRLFLESESVLTCNFRVLPQRLVIKPIDTGFFTHLFITMQKGIDVSRQENHRQ